MPAAAVCLSFLRKISHKSATLGSDTFDATRQAKQFSGRLAFT
jgi:hypothetical protein